MNQHEISGEHVVLRPACIEDRRLIYHWLACSDVAALMNGPPTYPDKPVPTWDEFRDSYAAHYFDDSAPELGRCFLIVVDGAPVGQVNYNDIAEHNGTKRTELDIWMSSREHCGRRSRTDALVALVPQHSWRRALSLGSGRTPSESGKDRRCPVPDVEGAADLSAHPPKYDGDAPPAIGGRYHGDRAVAGARGDGDDTPVHRGKSGPEGAGAVADRGDAEPSAALPGGR
jgi:RimJ/RimL family protein N-acetyltransferase